MSELTNEQTATIGAIHRPHQGLDAIRFQAELETADRSQTKRPTWAPAVVLNGELLELCREVEHLSCDDKPVARLWAVFADPRRIDVARKAAAHLAFGHGGRYCIGAPLARIELKAVYTQLIPRFPSMHLTVDPATLPTRRDTLAGGLVELPVSW